MALFKKKVDNRVSGQAYSYYYGGTDAGAYVTVQSAMQVSAVSACVRTISNAVSSLPLYLMKKEENGNTEKAIKHPLYKIMADEPNAEMTKTDFWSAGITQLLMYGNMYAQIIRNGKYEVSALILLMANQMTVDRDKLTGELTYTYRATDGDPKTNPETIHILNRDEVLHIRINSVDGIVGVSPIARVKNAIGVYIACEKFGASFFANGAMPMGVLTHPSTISDPERLRENWNAAHSGSNAHKVAVLEEGMKYETTSANNQESQFTETRRFQIEEIARAFDVPPHMIQDLSHSSYSTNEENSTEFYEKTIRPLCKNIEDQMHRVLLNAGEKNFYYFRFDLNARIRGNYSSQMSGLATGIQNGMNTLNEARAMLGLNRIDAKEADTLFLNGNMLPMDKVGAYADNKVKGASK